MKHWTLEDVTEEKDELSIEGRRGAVMGMSSMATNG